MLTVSDSARTYSSQSGDGASSDCCWLKSVPQVCSSDVTILLQGAYSGVSTAELIRKFQSSGSDETITQQSAVHHTPNPHPARDYFGAR